MDRTNRRTGWRAWLALGLTLLTAALAAPSAANPVSRHDAEDTARLLAALLDAGRVVVDRNQTFIDDPHKGYKGFTPEVFEGQVVAEFRRRTGVDLIHLKTDSGSRAIPLFAQELLPLLLQSSKEVVADAQIVINQRGIAYKNFIPATFGSQAARRFSARSAVGLKQTTLKPRNPKNEPDIYEIEVLQRFSSQPGPSSAVSELVEGGTILRVFTPLYYEKECLKCHGEPAGEEDIAGYPKEGGRLGGFAGAISVWIPLGKVP